MPDPTVLAFDTSAAHCAAALLSGDRIIGETVEEMAKGQAERLMPMLEQLLDETGHTWSDLHTIGVGVGPGNFTGNRIAVSAARGLALGLAVPAVGVSAFEATALYRVRPFAVTVKAPREQVYLQIFKEASDGTPRLCTKDGLDPGCPIVECLPPDELVRSIARIARDRRDVVSTRPAPVYIRPADAAPPREAPPVILP